ncbi:MAG: hypothetical protein WAK60_01435 [Sedimentisphaerales bacterium]
MSECSHFTSTHKKFGFIEAIDAYGTAWIKFPAGLALAVGFVGLP